MIKPLAAVGTLAALGMLLLLPALSAAAPTTAPRAKTTPAPRPTAGPTSAPCGAVWLVPSYALGPPRTVNGIVYERIKVRVSFQDDHTESAEFPYPWIYPNGEQTDPWSDTNLRRDVTLTTTLQLPPPDADVKTFAPLIRYVLLHTDANGYTNLADCKQPREKTLRAPASIAPQPGPPR